MKLPLLALFALLSTASCVHRTEAHPLPVTAVPLPRDDEWWQERHELAKAAVSETKPRILFVGDSITQGWETTGAEAWKEHFEPLGAANLGFSGDRTQHVLWRIQNGELEGIEPELVVLMIGTNNSGDDSSEDIAAGVEAIVEEFRAKLPEARILLLGIFPRGETKADERRQVVLGANAEIEALGSQDGVEYLDIRSTFLESGGTIRPEIMPDFLHLSPEGYRLWAEAIEDEVARLLGE